MKKNGIFLCLFSKSTKTSESNIIWLYISTIWDNEMKMYSSFKKLPNEYNLEAGKMNDFG